MAQVGPTLCLTSTGMDDFLLEGMKTSMTEEETVLVRPLSEFHFNSAKSRLMTLPILQSGNVVSSAFSKAEEAITLSSVLDVQSPESVFVYLCVSFSLWVYCWTDWLRGCIVGSHQT